jgi:hypothetical protein
MICLPRKKSRKVKFNWVIQDISFRHFIHKFLSLQLCNLLS